MELFNNKMTEFSGLAPIFPIPNLVFFPKTFLPLHIFEPRYLKMVLDAESNEKIICMTLLEEGYEDDYDKANETAYIPAVFNSSPTTGPTNSDLLTV